MSHIKNTKKLAKTALRKKALQIVEAGYAAIEIQTAIKSRITVAKGVLTVRVFDKKAEDVRIDLNDYKRVFLVGIGKGSALATVAVARVLGKHLTKGIALDVEKPNFKFKISNLKLLTGTHPLPSPKNVAATQKIMHMVRDLNTDDLVIVFMCGGGSALAVASDDELQASTTVFKELTKAGANIIELNTVRKHVSDIKGGNLAKAIHPATLLTLMASDVIGNDMEMIASGPTILDTTTKAGAEAILKKYGVSKKGISLKETPKEGRYFKNAKNVLFVSNSDAVRAMADMAKRLGLKAKVKTLIFEGEAKHALVPIVRTIKKGEAILLGGETTVTLSDVPAGKKPGKGGRNQEVALGVIAACEAMPERLADIVAISYASDGHDNSDAAGAIADGYALKAAKRAGQSAGEALALHASFSFFEKSGNLIQVKNKSFNVADLMLVIRGE
ncbi:hypothetical protein A2524_02325 [Candidatus Wolfebacteria bacterium RIFOXYD12_FULL_48_21]|uniref:Glycerate kinase n=1 Tax=Candidatus Wolfebacteria bacterium RIFOXYD1_FULL_48_65 TaxID=1802561 RepID=A0A1F8E1Y3_9BACT|nr:MAG: hypothetical protein A2524_02325 [Candidatus Wolfebacteria bacterium RIFOXYD12_FULL_48_21]OGM94806.1 MAG: hypothetical protein A2610_04040 [Candidatus Wolfebacteria bacterium RIFOXYD1_FULL_48_65]